MPTVIGVDVWHETSLMIVIILAGLTALPRDPIEAATVDGASRWQALRTVTLPLLRPVLLVAILIRMIAAMKTYDLIYILTRGGPGSATETISYSIWKNAFTSLDMGRAAAASFLLLAGDPGPDRLPCAGDGRRARSLIEVVADPGATLAGSGQAICGPWPSSIRWRLPPGEQPRKRGRVGRRCDVQDHSPTGPNNNLSPRPSFCVRKRGMCRRTS